MSYSAKYVRCKCGSGCDDYDHRNPAACEGQVMVHDADDICPRHECEVHARTPVSERMSRRPATPNTGKP